MYNLRALNTYRLNYEKKESGLKGRKTLKGQAEQACAVHPMNKQFSTTEEPKGKEKWQNGRKLS